MVEPSHTRNLTERKIHRLPADSYADAESKYVFTLCARHHGQPFTNPGLAKAVIDSLLWRMDRDGWLPYCYCLMPDHLHFLAGLPLSKLEIINAGARGAPPKGILEQIGRFKSFTTTQIWWRFGGTGALWQKSSYDQVIRWNDSVEAVIDYILNNPVRKGIVARWEDYPYSGRVLPG